MLVNIHRGIGILSMRQYVGRVLGRLVDGQSVAIRLVSEKCYQHIS